MFGIMWLICGKFGKDLFSISRVIGCKTKWPRFFGLPYPEYIHCVHKKNTRSHFLSYLHEWCVDLNKNCTEYTQGKVDSDNVEIRYLLRPMTSLWRHICLTKVGVSLQHAISYEPMISFFASTGYLLVHRRGPIVYYVVGFNTI